MKLFQLFFLFLYAIVLFPACEKEDPVIPNEEEVITTLNYVLTTDDPDETVTLSFSDLDGDGGDDPIITSGILKANTTYSGTLELLNEQTDPTEDITKEVEEEATDHQFFFTHTSGLAVSYSDFDSDGKPLGLGTMLSTSETGTEFLTITLRHQPNKSAFLVEDGVITNAGGETDIEVIFELDVE